MHPRQLPARWRFPAIALVALILGIALPAGGLRLPAAEAGTGRLAAVYPAVHGQVTGNRFSSHHGGQWGNPVDVAPYDRGEAVVFRASPDVRITYVEVGASCEGGNVVVVHMWDGAVNPIGQVVYRHVHAEVRPGWHRPGQIYGLTVMHLGRVVTEAPQSRCWTGPHVHMEASGWPVDYAVGAKVWYLDALYLWRY